ARLVERNGEAFTLSAAAFAEHAHTQLQIHARPMNALEPHAAALRQSPRGVIQHQTIVLSFGAFATYPADLPGAHPPFADLREAIWYRTARQDPQWFGPYRDPITDALGYTVSRTFMDRDGNEPAGVAAAFAPLAQIMPELRLPAGLSDDARVLIIGNAPDNPTAPDAAPALFLLGEKDATDDAPLVWGAAAVPPAFALDDPEHTARLALAITGQQHEVFHTTLDGVPALIAHATIVPNNISNVAVAVILPLDAVLAVNETAENQIATQVGTNLLTNAAIFVAVLIGAILIAFGASRAIARPVEELTDAANKLATGDLSARVDLKGSNEFDKLGDAFNAMGPQLADRLRMRDSLEMAMEVQQRLLPKEPPRVAGFELAGRSIYCDETGGDYFDFIEAPTDPNTDVYVMLGDVTGHGIAAAMLMATGRAMLRARADTATAQMSGSLADQLTDVNRQLTRDAAEGRFMTLFTLALKADAPLRWSSAGHDPAILIKAPPDGQAASIEELAGEDIPLAIKSDWTYHEHQRPPLAPGDTIVIGTDGIWEARNPSGEMYGKERFVDLLKANAGADPETLCARVVDAVTSFRDGHEQLDDITLVAIRATSDTSV
ncbi:MAG: SpoIIE family protein phosphatase, partial [Planctomycetota bacterium]